MGNDSRNNDARLFMTLIIAPIINTWVDRSSWPGGGEGRGGGHLLSRCSDVGVDESTWVHSCKEKQTCNTCTGFHNKTSHARGDARARFKSPEIQTCCTAAERRAGPPAPFSRHVCSLSVKPCGAAGRSSATTVNSAARPSPVGPGMAAPRRAAASTPSTSSSTTLAGLHRSCRASWSCCCSSPWATSSSGSSARGRAGTRTETAARSPPPSSSATHRLPRTRSWTPNTTWGSSLLPTCQLTTRSNICPPMRKACTRCTETGRMTACCRRTRGGVRAERQQQDRELETRDVTSCRCRDNNTAQGHLGTLSDYRDNIYSNRNIIRVIILQRYKLKCNYNPEC